MSEKISIPIGLDASGISADIQKASNNVGKATAGMARGISAAVGQSLGPFGELIEKADAFKSALGGITTSSKVLAGAVGLAGVAAVYSIKKAVDAYKEMRVAIDDAADAVGRLKQSNLSLPEAFLKEGVAPGKEAQALSALDRSRKELVGETMTDAQRESFVKAREDIESGEAGRRFTRNAYARNLSPEARKQMEEDEDLRQFGGMSTGELSKVRTKAEQDYEAASLRGGGEPDARIVNESIALIKKMDAFIAARMAAEQEDATQDAKDREEEEGVRGGQKFNAITPGQPMAPGVPTGYTMPSGYGVGGYTSTGGGGNIYGNTAGMANRIQSIADNVKKIADNTANQGEQTILTQ